MKEMPEMIYKWAVFVKREERWSMEASVESTSFSDAARDAGKEFRELKKIHSDKRIMVVKVFDTYEPS